MARKPRPPPNPAFEGSNDDPRDPAAYLRKAGVDIEANVDALASRGTGPVELDPAFAEFLDGRLDMIVNNMTREDYLEVITDVAQKRLEFAAELARNPGWEKRTLPELRLLAERFVGQILDEEEAAEKR